MKKVVLLFLVLTLVFSFAACNEATCDEHKDEDKNGICDVCGEKVTTGDNTGNDDKIDVTALGYTVVHHAYEPRQKQMAQAFIDVLEEETGVKLSLKNHNDKADEYEIQFGEVSSREETKDVLKQLDKMTSSETSAYAIVVKENVIVVTATNDTALKLASDKLVSMISDGKLLLAKDTEDIAVVYKNGDETVTVSADEFKASAALISISVGGAELEGFSATEKSYSAYFPATEAYPKISATALNTKSDVRILQAANNSGEAKITVISEDASKEDVYTVKFYHAESVSINSEIVNKNGADGVISFVFDDGLKQTADVLSTRLLPKYKDMVVSYAIITQDLATAGDKNGDKYELTPKNYKTYQSLPNSVLAGSYTYDYEFWKKAADVREGNELISHSHTHTDKLFTEPLFELAVSQQILRDLCGEQSLTFVNPGVSNPNNISSATYEQLKVSSGIYIGARAGGNKVATAPWIRSAYENRFKISSLGVQNHSTRVDPVTGQYTTTAESSRDDCLAAGIPRWTDYIDGAVNEGGWLAFCIHNVIPAGQTSNAKWHIYEEQMDALFAYAQGLVDNGKLWVTNFTDAQIYYNQWASAELSATLKGDESVTVSLEIPDTEVHKTYYTMAMTVKVPVPLSWTSANYTYGEATGELDVLENEDGSKYVYVDIAPGSVELVINAGE